MQFKIPHFRKIKNLKNQKRKKKKKGGQEGGKMKIMQLQMRTCEERLRERSKDFLLGKVKA